MGKKIELIIIYKRHRNGLVAVDKNVVLHTAIWSNPVFFWNRNNKKYIKTTWNPILSTIRNEIISAITYVKLTLAGYNLEKIKYVTRTIEHEKKKRETNSVVAGPK